MDVVAGNIEAKKTDRFFALDGLRGIAAFIVVIGHLFLMYPEAERLAMPLWIRISPLRILINGHASVILFFVLSGYVLSIPFLRGMDQPYRKYVIRRICRIYMPFAISILLAAVLYNYSTPVALGIGSDWFHKEWGESALTLSTVANHLMMTGIADEMWLNGVMWSLVVELRISIIFPILMYLSGFKRLSLVSAILIYVVTTLVIAINGWQLQTADNLAGTFLVTLRFIPFFMAGIFLAKNHEVIQKFLVKWTRLHIIIATIMVLFVFYMPTEIYNHKNISFISSIIAPENLNISMKFFVDILLGMASCALIVLVRNFGEQSALFNSMIIKWLGKISYSLYLVHLPLIFVIFRLLLGHLPFFAICLISIAASLVAASIFFIAVEKPSMRLGKRLTA